MFATSSQYPSPTKLIFGQSNQHESWVMTICTYLLKSSTVIPSMFNVVVIEIVVVVVDVEVVDVVVDVEVVDVVEVVVVKGENIVSPV